MSLLVSPLRAELSQGLALGKETQTNTEKSWDPVLVHCWLPQDPVVPRDRPVGGQASLQADDSMEKSLQR